MTVQVWPDSEYYCHRAYTCVNRWYLWPDSEYYCGGTCAFHLITTVRVLLMLGRCDSTLLPHCHCDSLSEMVLMTVPISSHCHCNNIVVTKWPCWQFTRFLTTAMAVPLSLHCHPHCYADGSWDSSLVIYLCDSTAVMSVSLILSADGRYDSSHITSLSP